MAHCVFYMICPYFCALGINWYQYVLGVQQLIHGGVSQRSFHGIVPWVGRSRLRLHGFRLGPGQWLMEGETRFKSRDHQWNTVKSWLRQIGTLPSHRRNNNQAIRKISIKHFMLSHARQHNNLALQFVGVCAGGGGNNNINVLFYYC